MVFKKISVLLLVVILTGAPQPAIAQTPSTEELTGFCASKPLGRYPVGTDCKQYIFCFLDIGIVGSLFSCSGGTLLDPLTLMCGSGVICPPAEETTTVVPTTKAPTTLQPTTVTPTTVAPTTPVPTTVAPTTFAPTTKAIAPLNAFCVPKAGGRYPVIGSKCKQYVYCYSYKDEMKGQLYSCAGTTLFNPATLECVPNFKCTA